MKETTLIIIGLLVIGSLSLFIDTSITIAIVSGLIGYLVPKQDK